MQAKFNVDTIINYKIIPNNCTEDKKYNFERKRLRDKIVSDFSPYIYNLSKKHYSIYKIYTFNIEDLFQTAVEELLYALEKLNIIGKKAGQIINYLTMRIKFRIKKFIIEESIRNNIEWLSDNIENTFRNDYNDIDNKIDIGNIFNTLYKLDTTEKNKSMFIDYFLNINRSRKKAKAKSNELKRLVKKYNYKSVHGFMSIIYRLVKKIRIAMKIK